MGSNDNDRPEPREAHCQCCGGYAGMGRPDPEFCAACRSSGEHLHQDDSIKQLEDAKVGDTVSVSDDSPSFEIVSVNEDPSGFGGEAVRQLNGQDYYIVLGDTRKNKLAGGGRACNWARQYERRLRRNKLVDHRSVDTDTDRSEDGDRDE